MRELVRIDLLPVPPMGDSYAVFRRDICCRSVNDVIGAGDGLQQGTG